MGSNIKHICAMLEVLGFQCLSTKEPLVCYTMKLPMILYVHIMFVGLTYKGVVSCFDITAVLPDHAKIHIKLLCSWCIFGFSVR